MRYKQHCIQDNDISVPFKVGTLGPHTVLPASLPLFKTLCKIFCWNCPQLPHHTFLNLIDGPNLFPFKSDFSFEKSQKSQGNLYTVNTLRCSACCRPSRMWITFNGFSTIFEAFVPHFYLHSTHYIIPKSSLYHPNGFCGGMFKLNTKFDADSSLYLLSHFECDGHTVHMLPQWLAQWRHHCSHRHIPVHSPWLPGYITVMQTVLVILTSG